MRREERMQILKTVSTFMLLLVLVSLMGWCAIEPPPAKPLHLEYDRVLVKESLVRNQAQAMAAATASYNAWLDKRAKQ